MKSEDLAVFVVWIPVVGGDSFEATDGARELISDARATHYWDGDQDLGVSYGRVVELPRGSLAWDIYFVYEAGAEWGEAPPKPSYWAHQLGMDGKHLGDGSRLTEAVRKVVEGD